MTSQNRANLEAQIIKAVARIQRDFGSAYPWQVQMWIDEYRDESTLRRHMVRLAQRGLLVRVGGWHRRKGYRVDIHKTRRGDYAN